MVDPAVVAVAWQERCELFAARNKTWMRVAALWLAATGALLAAAFLSEEHAALYGASAAVLFIVGMPVFQIASFGLSRALQCPSCGQRALPRGFKAIFVVPDPATLQSCNSCGCRLRVGGVA